MSDPSVQPASPADAVTAAAITCRHVRLPYELTDEYGSIEAVSMTACELRPLDGRASSRFTWQATLLEKGGADMSRNLAETQQILAATGGTNLGQDFAGVQPDHTANVVYFAKKQWLSKDPSSACAPRSHCRS